MCIHIPESQPKLHVMMAINSNHLFLQIEDQWHWRGVGVLFTRLTALKFLKEKGGNCNKKELGIFLVHSDT